VNKSGLVEEIAKKSGSSKAEVARTIDAAIDTIRETVATGERVALAGFGTFERKHRNQRIARNPRRPKVPIVVPARDVPAFNPGNQFREAVASRRRKRQPARRSR
jgi:DNA-binding protein HU-beta